MYYNPETFKDKGWWDLECSPIEDISQQEPITSCQVCKSKDYEESNGFYGGVCDGTDDEGISMDFKTKMTCLHITNGKKTWRGALREDSNGACSHLYEDKFCSCNEEGCNFFQGARSIASKATTFCMCNEKGCNDNQGCSCSQCQTNANEIPNKVDNSLEIERIYRELCMERGHDWLCKMKLFPIHGLTLQLLLIEYWFKEIAKLNNYLDKIQQVAKLDNYLDKINQFGYDT